MIIEDTNNIKPNPSDEISIADLISKVKEITKYLKSKWIIILSFSLLGALLGLGYSILKKPTYTAVCTFVLEDAKKGGNLSQYAGLASIAGVTIGEGNNGIFQGDNIIELYKSRLMIEKTLLTNIKLLNKNQLLIDRYISFNNINKKVKNEKGIIDMNFNGDYKKFNRAQDSLISEIVIQIKTKILDVSKPDKKLSIIKVDVNSHDELFSKYFSENLVQNVNDFYILAKTKKEKQNVQILQRQADSLKEILNQSIYNVAIANDASPNANPQLSTLRTNTQKRQIDVQVNTAIYTEVVKNLELAKISLRQEIPLIQVIDNPILPLTVNKVGKIIGSTFGFFMGFLISITTLLAIKFLKFK